MAFVAIEKGRRRKRRPRSRPEWQDVRPGERALRDAYAIAAKHERRFTRAFMSLTRNLVTDENRAEILEALKMQNIEGVVRAIPVFGQFDPHGDAVWGRLMDRIKPAYAAVMQDSGRATMREMKLPIVFEVKKADGDVPIVPVNPFSLAWLDLKAAELVKNVSEQARTTVRQMLFEGFERGERPEVLLERIAEQVGLLPREQKWVDNFRKRMQDAGAKAEKVEAATARYAELTKLRRARRIARTETIAAQNAGLNDSWTLANEQGLIPTEVKRQWIAANESDRTCKICSGLNNQTVAINAPFWSDVLGRSINQPPAHPHCRCTMVLTDEDEQEQG